MNNVVNNVDEVCKKYRHNDAVDGQLILIRLDELEALVDLAKKGEVLVDMIHKWAKMTKEEKENE